MEFLKYPTLLLGLLLFILLHIGSAIIKGKLSKLINYVNLALHIIFLIPMMTLGLTIEDAVLMYMISVFVYTLTQTLVYRKRGVPNDTPVAKSEQPTRADTIEEQVRIREAKGITADASPIKNTAPVKYDFEPVRIQTEKSTEPEPCGKQTEPDDKTGGEGR